MSATVGNDLLSGNDSLNDVIDLLAGNDTYAGLGGNDSILGNDGNDSISGGEGADTIFGGNGSDSISGGNGNDFIIGEAGSDSIDAGAGTFDVIRFNQSGGEAITANIGLIGQVRGGSNIGTVATATQGTDSIINFEYINGSSNNDSFNVTDAATFYAGLFLFANSGNDTITSSADLYGPYSNVFADYDAYSAANTAAGFTRGVSVDLQIGTDTLGRPIGSATDFAGTDRLVGMRGVAATSLNDTIYGTAFDDRFRPYAGNDIMDGREGFDMVDYGTNSSSQAVSVNLATGRASDGRGGTDTLISIENARGGSGNDTLLGDKFSEVFRGGVGNDSIDGGLGSDRVEYFDTAATAGVSVNLITGTASDGRGGIDRFTSIENAYGGELNDYLVGIGLGGQATSRLRGDAGSDTLIGIDGEYVVADYGSQTLGLSVNLASGSVNDGMGGIDSLVNIRGAQMYGNFADTLIGSNGDDWLAPSGGNDSIVGGNGFDILSYGGNPTRGVSVNLATGTANDGDGGTDNFTGIEVVLAGYSDDTVIGDSGTNGIVLGAGADYADAAGGRDVVSYRFGFSPGAVAYSYNESGNGRLFSGVTIDLAAGRATDYGNSVDTILNFEDAEGSTMHDSILGSSGDNELDGWEGNDTINGGAGNDTIFSDAGDDLFMGGAGNDLYLMGYATGRVIIDDASGNDTVSLDGAAGQDIAVADLDGASGIEAIDLAWGGNALHLTAARAVSVSGTGLFRVFGGSVDSLVFDDTGWVRTGSSGGFDTMSNSAGNATVISSSGLVSSDVGSVVTGGDGNDTLAGANGADTIDGGNGADIITGFGGSDSMLGGDGADSISGGDGADTALGGAGNDLLLGSNGNDSLSGGDGADTLIAGGLADTLTGGAGNDLYLVAGMDNGLIIDSGGDDTLSMLGGAFDTTSASAGDLSGGVGIEAIDIAGSGHVLGLTAASVIALSDTDVLRVFGSGNDVLVFEDAGWNRGATSGGFVTFTNGGATIIAAESLVPAAAGPTAGDDLLSGTSGNDVIDLLAGNDSYLGLVGDDSILGNDGADTIYGGDGADTILGGAGNDRIYAELGNDSVDAGSGNQDRVFYNQTGGAAITATITSSGGSSGVNTAIVTTASQGNDSLQGFEFLYASGGADSITVTSAATATELLWVFGGGGNDTLVDNYRQFGVFADFTSPNVTAGIVVNLANGTATDGFGGTDSLVGFTAVNATKFDDTLVGSNSNDRFRGWEGNDSILGGNGTGDIIDYNYLSNASQAVSVDLVAQRANDGMGGTDTLISIEQVRGGAGNDTIIGDGADNVIRGNSGSDSLDGGIGTGDVADYSFNSLGVSVNLATGRGGDTSTGTDTLAGFERVWGSASGDTLIGSINDDVLRGNGGSDSIDGGLGSADVADYRNATNGISVNLATGAAQDGQGGIDTLVGIERVWGSTFNDTMVGGNGNDVFDGGDGSDVAAYNGNASTQAVSVNLLDGRASDGLGGTDTLISIENVWGGAGNDTIIGGDGADFLWGNSGSDTVLGGNGADTLDGGSGDDTIAGGDGNDRIFGANGSDSIDAGAGTGDFISFNHTSAQAVSATISAIGGSGGSNYAEVRTASQGNDTIINFENIDGSFENDGFTINSAATDNALLFVGGLIGADTIAVNVASNAVMANYNIIAGSVNFTRGVIVDLNAGTADDGRGGIDSLIGVRGVSGSSFGDTILGSAFNDRFRENGGSDSINGRDGMDMLDYSGNSASQSVSVNLAAERATDGRGGTDTVISMEYVRSGSGNDTLIGSSADNEFRGGSGADILDGGASGFDIADYANNTSAQAISVNLTTGRASDGFGFNDTLVSIEYVRGGSGDDTMIGGDANERFRGNAGNDTIDGGGGTEDILDLAQTTQSVSANLVTGLANDGLGGTDRFTDVEVVYSGTANDTLLGSDRNEIFDGGMGGDRIDGGLGYDRVRYWNVSGSNSAITRGVSVDLAAQRATDGWGGQDTLIGIERVTATNFADTLLGDNVGNRFNGRAGNDSIDGGLSIDWLEYLDGDATSGVTVNLTTGTASDGRGGTDIFTSIENVSGQDFADHLTGIAQLGRSTSRLRGGGGNDTLVGIANEFVTADYTDQTMGLSVNLASGSVNDGLGGIDQLVNIRGAIMLGNYADTIIGTAGNDWLSPGGGNDTVSGGGGLDILSFDGNPTSGVSVNLAAGRASDGDGGTDSLSGIEGVWVSYSNDTVIGDGQGNLIGLGAGADSADAAAGQDTISYSLGFSPNTLVYVFNEAGNQLPFSGVTIDLAAGRATDQSGASDTILNFEAAIGSTMHDSILGSNGNDVLDGAEGNDTINGGGGGDTIYAGAGDVIHGGAGDDVILAGNVTLADIYALFGP